jgi:hypothetical protein
MKTVRGVSGASGRAPRLTRMTQVVNTEFALLPGFFRAVTSSLREGPLRGMDHAFSALGALAASGRLRVLLLWVCRRPRMLTAYPTCADAEAGRARQTTRCRSTMRTPCRSTSRTCVSSPFRARRTIYRSRTRSRCLTPWTSSSAVEGVVEYSRTSAYMYNEGHTIDLVSFSHLEMGQLVTRSRALILQPSSTDSILGHTGLYSVISWFQIRGSNSSDLLILRRRKRWLVPSFTRSRMLWRVSAWCHF